LVQSKNNYIKKRKRTTSNNLVFKNVVCAIKYLKKKNFYKEKKILTWGDRIQSDPKCQD